MSRYAAKSFDGRNIPEEKFGELIEIIRHAPSSFNIQPWVLYVVRDKSMKERLQKAAWDQPQIMSSSHLIVFCINTDVLGNIKRLEDLMKRLGAGVDKMKNVFDMMRAFVQGMSEEQVKCWAGRQVYLALANAVNGAKSLGFDSCPMEGFDANEFSRILKIPRHLIPIVLCPVGYANDSPKPKVRFDSKDILVEQNFT